MAHDIGDLVPLSTQVRDASGALTDTTVVLTVTDPTGTTSTPTVVHDGTGAYSAAVPVDRAGTWRYRWDASGVVTDVDHGEFVVAADPPARLGPLATVGDLEDTLGRALTDAELARAPGLLSSASTKVRAFCRQTFSFVADDTVVLRATGATIRLPERPVTAVSSVVAVGSGALPDLRLAAWVFDQIDTIALATGYQVINLPEGWYDGGYPGTYRVTYSHGHRVPPDPVVDVVTDMVVRCLTAPATGGGIVSETIGSYSYRLDQAGAGLGVRLTADDKQILADAGLTRRDGAGTRVVRQ